MRDLGVITKYPRLAVAQAENANPLYRAWSAGKREVEPIAAKPTLATAIQIGNPVSAPRAVQALEAMNGVVEQASEEELCDAAARADRTGMYTCPHTAVGLAVLEKLVNRGTIQRGERVVCVSTAAGLKFTEFKVQYHEGAVEGVSAKLKNPPVKLAADYGQVMDAISKRFS
jgi:threonine synthase